MHRNETVIGATLVVLDMESLFAFAERGRSGCDAKNTRRGLGQTMAGGWLTRYKEGIRSISSKSVVMTISSKSVDIRKPGSLYVD